MRYTPISSLLFACAAIAFIITGAAGAEPAVDPAQGMIPLTNPPAPGFFTSDRWPAPFAFSFADGRCGTAPGTWHWDFGDGSRSHELNPAYTYRIHGDYTVSLTMTSRYGRVTKTTLTTPLESGTA